MRHRLFIGCMVFLIVGIIFATTTFADSFEFSANILELSLGSYSTPNANSQKSGHGDYDQPDMFTGTASYDYEIKIPQAANGLTPRLGLTYHSTDNSNGLFGVGWELRGFSYIERNSKNGAPNYTNDDNFVLNIDGFTYELVRDSTNTNGTGYYHTKAETWKRIYFNGSQWTVTDKDGTVSVFGTAIPIVGNTSYIRRWVVDSVTDTFGNFISYNYTLDSTNGEYYPNTIIYNQNKFTVNKARRISFSYEYRSDNIQPWARTMQKRVNSISILVDAANWVQERYDFGYGISKSSNRSLLAQVAHWSSLDSKTKEQTYFNYDSENSISTPLESDVASTFSIPGDIDGNGLTDWITAFVQEGYPNYYDVTYNITGIVLNNEDGTRKNIAFSGISTSSYRYNPQPSLQDINGDGKDDLIYNAVDGKTNVYINTYPSSPAFKYSSTWTDWFKSASNQSSYVRFLDLNHDGVLEYLLNKNNEIQVTGDVNGDGWPEYTIGGKLYFNRGDGSKWSLPSSISSVSPIGSYGITDYNGDGLADIYMYQNISWYVSLYLNTSSGWVKGEDFKYPFTIDRNLDGIIDTNTDSRGSIGYGYINDDPFPDIFLNSFTKTTASISQLKPDLLTKVTLPTGGTIKYEYGRKAVKNYRDDGSTLAPYRMYVVKKISTDDGDMYGRYSSSFEYLEDGKRSWTEGQFLGFGKVKKTFPNGEYAITSYSQELQTAGRVKQVDYYNKSNTLMQSEINTWVVRANKGTKTDSSGNYLGYDIVLATQELKHYNSGKTLCGTATISYGYDTFGNATTELRKSNDASVVKYNRSYVNQPSDSNYLVGLLAREQAVDPNSNDKPLSDKLIWYDNQALGKGAQGKVTAVKDWLDTFAGMNYGDDTFYSTNSSYPVTTADDPHPLVKYSYDSYGNKTVTTKHNLDLDKKATEQTETVSYDSTYHTFPVTFTNARGQMTTTVVNDYGQPIKVIDPNGGVTTYSYDSLWRVTAEYGPEDGVNPKIKYDYSNALTGIPSTQYIKVQRQIAVGGATYLSSKNYLNGFGRNSREERESAEGKTAYKYWQYEWNGFMSFEGLDSNDSYFGFTRGTFFGYDSLKRPVRIQKADSCSGGLSYTNYTYDGLLTTMKVSDNNSKVLYLVQHSKDAFGRLVSTRQMASEGGPYIGIDYEYDGLDRQTSKRNVDTQSSTTSTMKYDSLGRLMTQVDPFSGTTRFQYDLVGNVLKKTDNDGNQLLYSYDLLNRPTGKSVLVKGTTNLVTLASWVYDESNRENGIGKLTTAKLGSNTVDSVFNYNLEGNLTKTTKFIDGKAYTTESTYDVQNRLTKLTYPDNTEVNYTYDADYLKTVGNYVTYSNWIASGAPQNVTYGNGVTTSYRYNTYADNKLLALETKNSAGTLIQSFGYSYDAAGNILAINDNAPITTMHSTNISQTFTYDGSNRLTSSSVWGFYSYDKMGNILSKEGVTFTYGDTAHPNCPTSASNGYQAGYDANGNLAWKKDSKGIWWKYSYDYENRLTAVYKGTAKGSETLFEEYAYDSAGVRTKKMNYKNNTTTYFINYGTNVLYEKTGALSTKYILNGDGREIARVTGTTTIYTHRDHLGSASVNTDSSGNTVGWYATRPYGEVWNVGTGSVVENHSFTGKETDDSGLVYFGARYYDTEMGRFISVDPAQDGDNWYTYCNNNPLTFIDLFGLTPYYLPGVVYGDNTSMTNTSTGRSITPGTIVSREVVKYGNGSFDVVYTTKEPDRNGELHTTFQETLSFGKKKELTETNLCFSINGRPLLRVRDEWDNKGKVRETVFSWHERTKKEAWWINGTVKNTFFIGSFYFSEAKAIAALPRLLRLGLSWGIDQVVVPDVTKQGETYVEVSTRYYRYW